jgi:hypothetical protein
LPRSAWGAFGDFFDHQEKSLRRLMDKGTVAVSGPQKDPRFTLRNVYKTLVADGRGGTDKCPRFKAQSLAKGHHPNTNLKTTTPTKNMKSIIYKLRTLALAAGTLAVTAMSSFAQADPSYEDNDLVLFFRNPAGAAGTTLTVGYSLGSTWDLFRRAATPGDATFGTVISLGNINSILTSTYSTDWTSLSSTLFMGAAGKNASTDGGDTQVENGDFARTVYITSPRSGAGTYQERNSTVRNSPSSDALSATVSGNIDGANSSMLDKSNPVALTANQTIIDNQNPISNGNATTAYGGINAGVMGKLSTSTYAYGSISNVTLALDLMRITPTLANGDGDVVAWQNEYSIASDYGGSGGNGSAYYLGTITLSSNGDVNFAAVPEPSTYALLALAAAGLGAHVIRRRQKQS